MITIDIFHLSKDDVEKMNKITSDIVTEGELIGILCSIINIVELKSKFEIEISMGKQFSLFPLELQGSFSLKNKYQQISTFCENLQTPNGELGLDILPIYSTNDIPKPLTYYLPDFITQEFIKGYTKLSKTLQQLLNTKKQEIKSEKQEIKSEKILKHEVKNIFPTDTNYLLKSKLIHSITDGVCHKTKFGLKVPAYVWELPDNNNIYMEQLVSNMISLFLRDCTDEDHTQLLETKSFLKILLYQDGPNTRPYAYAYILNIERCTYSSHKNILTTCRMSSENILPCEITLGLRGYFFNFPRTEWINKTIKHISSLD